MKESVSIGLMGLGVVGSRVAQGLMERRDTISSRVRVPIALARVLVRDPHKKRSADVLPLITLESKEITQNPAIDIVVELMGGEDPATSYIKEALNNGKHVVTAKKEVIAKYGPELLAQASKKGVGLLFESSVGGGIPLVYPLTREFSLDRIESIYAIINGTTNFILSQMAKGADFTSALKNAQELGYAEPDPQNDIQGLDCAYKLSILATLGFRNIIRPHEVYTEGISKLCPRDFAYAQELGYIIKLLSIAKDEGGYVEARVHPTLIPQSSSLAEVDGVYNAVQVQGDLVGKVMFYGEGAGASSTSSAVISDIIDVAQKIVLEVKSQTIDLKQEKPLRPMGEVRTRYYLRMRAEDKSGVLAQIAKALGDNEISISSVIQKETSSGSAELVIMTHIACEGKMRRAREEIELLPSVLQIESFIRVED
jgi:homoserine dehydrogenase